MNRVQARTAPGTGDSGTWVVEGEVRKEDGKLDPATLIASIGDWAAHGLGITKDFSSPSVVEIDAGRAISHAAREDGIAHWALRIDWADEARRPTVATVSTIGDTTFLATRAGRDGCDLLATLAAEFRLCRDGVRLLPRPFVTRDADGIKSLMAFARSPSRRLPIVAITEGAAREDGCAWPIDPHRLATMLLGIAHVVTIPPDATFILTDVVGKRLSVFGGAARIYKPVKDDHLEPSRHPIIFRPEGHPDEAAAQKDMIDRIVPIVVASGPAPALPGYDRIAGMETSFSLARALDDGRGGDPSDLADIASLTRRLRDSQGTLRRTLSKLSDAEAEIARLRRAAGSEISRPPDLDGDGDPRSFEELIERVSEKLRGRIILSGKAIKTMKSFSAPSYSLYGTAYKALDILSNEYRMLRQSGGADLDELYRRALDAIHMEARPISKKLHSNRKVSGFLSDDGGAADWHLRSRGNPHDPSHCLRIYFFWDPARQCAVVTHMPGYLG